MPIYPLLPIVMPMAPYLAVPAKLAFAVHTFVKGSYSQKSFLATPSLPVPTYPFVPIAIPTADERAVPPKSAICVHVFVSWSNCQKSFNNVVPLFPVPTYALPPMENATASLLVLPPISSWVFQSFAVVFSTITFTVLNWVTALLQTVPDARFVIVIVEEPDNGIVVK